MYLQIATLEPIISFPLQLIKYTASLADVDPTICQLKQR
jgi:hypothetical protein